MKHINPISIAPMMNYTDRFYRYMMRLITKSTLLYTEMITTRELLHCKNNYLIKYDPIEHPLALQLGGSDPFALQQCSMLAADYGFDEVNLNIGCPSERVQSGNIGACLMAEPELVGSCVSAIKEKISMPVSVKTRIGIDHQDDYDFLYRFVTCVTDAGCDKLIVHARKAWLKGLSPKENREIPPLCYDVVYQLKRDFPNLPIVINGGITTWEQAKQHMQYVDGVMLGRIACSDPYMFADVDRNFYGSDREIPTRQMIEAHMRQYISRQSAEGIPQSCLIKPLLGLYRGVSGAREWRRSLSNYGIFTEILEEKEVNDG